MSIGFCGDSLNIDLLCFLDDGSIHPAVLEDIQSLFEGLTQEKLSEVETLIRQSLKNGEMVDEEFWISLLKRLTYFFAKAQIDGAHKDMVRKRLRELAQQGMADDQRREIMKKFFVYEVKKQEVIKPVEEEHEVDGIVRSYHVM